MLRKSGFDLEHKSNDFQQVWPKDRGQNCPQHCPHRNDSEIDGSDPLGKPLSIREVAKLIGCSAWTVRQRYLPAGVPCIRVGRTGKLIFYRNQVIGWLLMKQQKGGTIL